MVMVTYDLFLYGRVNNDSICFVLVSISLGQYGMGWDGIYEFYDGYDMDNYGKQIDSIVFVI